MTGGKKDSMVLNCHFFSSRKKHIVFFAPTQTKRSKSYANVWNDLSKVVRPSHTSRESFLMRLQGVYCNTISTADFFTALSHGPKVSLVGNWNQCVYCTHIPICKVARAFAQPCRFGFLLVSSSRVCSLISSIQNGNSFESFHLRCFLYARFLNTLHTFGSAPAFLDRDNRPCSRTLFPDWCACCVSVCFGFTVQIGPCALVVVFLYARGSSNGSCVSTMGVLRCAMSAMPSKRVPKVSCNWGDVIICSAAVLNEHRFPNTCASTLTAVTGSLPSHPLPSHPLQCSNCNPLKLNADASIFCLFETNTPPTT